MTLIGNRPSLSESAPASHVIVATRSSELAATISGALVDELTTVSLAATSADVEALGTAPDMLVLDSSSPELVDPRFVARLRHRWVTLLLVAVLVPDEDAAAVLLDAGVDDAIERRSSTAHLLARLNASARRMRTANALLRRRVGDVVYDRENRRVWCAGEEVEFAPRELAVLDALWMRAGELVRHESLQDYVWSGIDEGERSNRLEVYISYVRRKLQGSKEVTIQTLRGAGYRLVRKSATDTPWHDEEV
jgi:DNA-binding response OmpR family regulator